MTNLKERSISSIISTVASVFAVGGAVWFLLKPALIVSISEAVADVMKKVREQTILNIGVLGNLDAAARLLEGHEIVSRVEARNGQLTVTLREGVEDYSDLSALLVQAGHKLSLFREEELTLESAFMALTKGMGAKT